MESDLSQRPRSVIFDMDGLMLESEQLWSEVDRQVTRTYGRTYDPALKTRFMGCEKIESARRFCEAYRIEAAPETVAEERLQLAYRFYRESVTLMPGLTGLVSDIADWGTPMAVATSADGVILSIVREKFQIFSAFQALVCADEVPRGKPAPDLFLEAAARLGAPAPASVVLEDSPIGVQAALAAGMKVIGVPNPEVGVSQMKEAHLVVDRLEDLSRDTFRNLFDKRYLT